MALSYIRIATVVTQPPRPKGRKQVLTPTPVEEMARKHKLSVFTPKNLDGKAVRFLKSKRPQLGILAAYGKIISPSLIKVFPKGILNVHPSWLPQFRGATPIEAALISGQEKTGVSIFLIDSKVDHGSLISQKKERVLPDDNQKTLGRRLFQAGAQLLARSLPQYISGEIIPRPQKHPQATFTKRLNRQDGYIGIQTLRKAIMTGGPEAIKIERQIRAYYPWPGTYTEVNSKFQIPNSKSKKRKTEVKRMKILKAHLENKKLVLDIVQFEGKKPTAWNKNLQKIILE